MAKINLPSDFAKEIAKSLGMTDKWVDEWFTVEEDKQGYFIAKLKPKKFLEKDQFRTMCALARDLGGEGYLEGMKAWKIVGPLAKKPMPPADTTSTPSPTATWSKPEPSGVTPHVVSMDKSKPSYITVPIKALFSMPFQSRTTEDPELEELVESVKTYGVLEPILVRLKPPGLYEIVAGERRIKAAEKAGLVEVPVIIRWLTDEEAFIIQATENLHRKDWTEEEKTRYLGWLAKKTGWNAQQIADKLKMSYQWVVKYLPSEFKAEQQSEAGKASGAARAESVLRRGTESQDIRQPEQPMEPKAISKAYRESEDSAQQREMETQPKIPPAQPFSQATECSKCHVPTWFGYRLKDGRILCSLCFMRELKEDKVSVDDLLAEGEAGPVEVRRKFKVIISLDPPLVFIDNWPSKPSKDQVLEMLADDICKRKYDVNFHVVIEEVKELQEEVKEA